MELVEAKKVFDERIKTGEDPEKIVKEKGLIQVTDVKKIENIIDKVIANNQQSVDDYREGTKKALGFLVGQVMKESQGKANPKIVNELMSKKLG